jgi:hypothetical protein
MTKPKSQYFARPDKPVAGFIKASKPAGRAGEFAATFFRRAHRLISAAFAED